MLNPRLSIFSMGPVLNMSNLDLGLLLRKVMQAKEEERRKLLLGEEVLAISKPIVLCVMFACAKGVQKHLRGGCTKGCTKGCNKGG